MATIPASENEFPEVLFAEGAAPATPASGLVKAYAKSDGLLYSKDDAGTETALSAGDHIADTTDAHDASAISIADSGAYFTGTDVEAALQELGAGGGGGGSVATDAIWDAAGDLAVGTGANTAAKLTAGSAGTRLVSAGAAAPVWTTFPKVINRLASGDVTISATTNVFASNVTGLGDITLAAVSGDYIEIGVSAIWPNTTAQSAKLDVCTVVSAAAVNFLSTASGTGAANGVPGWYATTSVIGKAGGSVLYIAQSGDLSGGNIVLRLLAFVSASNRVLGASSANHPLIFWAMNHRQ